MTVLDRRWRRAWLLGVAVGVLGATVVIAVARPWHESGTRSGEVRVERASLQSGQVVLVLVNDSEDAARVAQVIFNDAFVDFRQTRRGLPPGDAERITVSYPWVRGESYEVQLMTSTGATVDYEIEDAEAGTRAASA